MSLQAAQPISMMVAQDGGIFSFGDVAFHGSLGSNPPSKPVICVALQP